MTPVTVEVNDVIKKGFKVVVVADDDVHPHCRAFLQLTAGGLLHQDYTGIGFIRSRRTQSHLLKQDKC